MPVSYTHLSAIAPGQSAVFYEGKRVLGGAFIASQRGIRKKMCIRDSDIATWTITLKDVEKSEINGTQKGYGKELIVNITNVKYLNVYDLSLIHILFPSSQKKSSGLLLEYY